MVKRVASSVLWFMAVAWGWNYLALVADLPSAVGLVLASSIAAYVCLDPLQRVWHGGEKRSRIIPRSELRDTLPPSSQAA
jgi:hypothetical protein